MEDAPLNQAHFQRRCAEKHIQYRRYNEAIECHMKAAEFLKEALKCTSNQKAIESINHQITFHLRQPLLILSKQRQHEEYQKTVENRNIDLEDNKDNDVSIKVAIYRNMEETDSLLDILIKGSSGNSDSESLKSFSTTDTDEKLGSVDALENRIIGTKHPKDTNTVIEELRTLNQQLNKLVNKLVTQLDASQTEIELLKERIKQLENDKSKAQNKNASSNLKVVTDSSGGTSPFVFSPSSELSPEVNDPARALPPLAPLEMPSFDFTNIINSVSNIKPGN